MVEGEWLLLAYEVVRLREVWGSGVDGEV